ncbi:MAG: GGDEF domain-containing protein [Kofleriaceae bacterium]|nr:GGDEF domain-containing protein [Kofleriaceae bacterium]MCB9575108.1 GGDEF domain-containing protein [Kofleriaceae bacterium]
MTAAPSPRARPPAPPAARIQRARAEVNLRRLGSLLWIAAVVHAVHVAWIGHATVTDATGARWRQLIVAGHATMGAVALILWIAARLALRRGPDRAVAAATALTAAAAIAYPVFGAWLAGVDQLVTSNVTPLIVTGFGIAIGLRLSTAVATVAYTAQLAVALTMLLAGPGRPEAVSSNLVNAVSIAALGWAVARVLEVGRVHELAQRLTIEEQAARLADANRELAALSAQDELTGLANRRAFVSRGAELVRDARDRGLPTAIVLADADHFKTINDRHGHGAGDDVLRMIARQARAAVRTDDLVARLGGEEFALVLPGMTEAAAADLADALRAAIAADAVTSGGATIHVTASFGVGELGAADAEPLEAALARTDRAMYAAKRAGRDRVVRASTLATLDRG